MSACISDKPRFIDLFAGCGGLSLGLMQAGWQGVFAIEKTPDAFETFNCNFNAQSARHRFHWPHWLPQSAMTTSALLLSYKDRLKDLRDTVDLIAGGPPCQGFSSAGLRNKDDPRNRLTDEYVEIVRLVQPRFLLLENVRGFQSPFNGESTPYSEKVVAALTEECGIGYNVRSALLNAADFGIPQPRKRFIMIAVRKDLDINSFEPFERLAEARLSFREKRNLNGHQTGVAEAIGDLELGGCEPRKYENDDKFNQITYAPHNQLTPYQKLLRSGLDKHYQPNSLRLPNHRPEIRSRFQQILQECPRGVTLNKAYREKFGLKKQCFTPLHPEKLARTVTTLPDDMIHYSEPRILTVRENARLQSFPDWFEFRGKYTTGGHRRKQECPRYTQVGNAVPPLLAEAIGEVLMEMSRDV